MHAFDHEGKVGLAFARTDTTSPRRWTILYAQQIVQLNVHIVALSDVHVDRVFLPAALARIWNEEPRTTSAAL